MPRRSLLVLSMYDSFAKASLPVARLFRARGWDVRHVLVERGDGGLSAAQRRAIGFDRPFDTVRPADAPALPGLHDHDAVALFLDGTGVRDFVFRFHRRLPAGAARRPMLLAGYPGLVYENHVHGFVCRQGVDLHLINSPADLERFQAVARALGTGAGNLILTGLPFLPAPAPPAVLAGPPAAVLFAAQPDVPARRADRAYIARRLVAYAERHPGTIVYLKPRHRPGETTLRKEVHRYEVLLAGIGRRPPNLQVVYDPVEELLERVELCLTVSSTVAIQAICRGVAVGILCDFGVREDFGNHFFLDSGALTTFDALEAGRPVGLDPAWVARHVAGGPERLDDLAAAVDAWLDRQTAAGAPLPPFDAFLARHGQSYLRFCLEEGGGGRGGLRRLAGGIWRRLARTRLGRCLRGLIEGA